MLTQQAWFPVTINGVGTFMIITGATPAQHFSGVSHHRRRSRQVDYDFAGAVRLIPTHSRTMCVDRSAPQAGSVDAPLLL